MGKIMLNGIQYGVGGIEQAKDISYDNTESGATATDVQGALDELNAGLTAFRSVYSGTLVGGSGRAISTNAQYTSLTLTEKGLYLLSAETTGMNINGRTFAFCTGDGVAPELSMYPQTANTEYYQKEIVQFVNVSNPPVTISMRYWDSNNIPEHKYKIYKLLG